MIQRDGTEYKFYVHQLTVAMAQHKMAKLATVIPLIMNTLEYDSEFKIT